MVFHWSLSDSKSPQVSKTLLSILVDLNNAVDWMVSIRPLISKSSSPCINSMVSVPRAPITIGITVTFMFHNFLKKISYKVEVLILFAFFQVYSEVLLLLLSLLFVILKEKYVSDLEVTKQKQKQKTEEKEKTKTKTEHFLNFDIVYQKSTIAFCRLFLIFVLFYFISFIFFFFFILLLCCFLSLLVCKQSSLAWRNRLT